MFPRLLGGWEGAWGGWVSPSALRFCDNFRKRGEERWEPATFLACEGEDDKELEVLRAHWESR